MLSPALTAFAAIGELRAQDQTLDHLDVILSEIDGRAAARERKRRLEIAGLIDQVPQVPALGPGQVAPLASAASAQAGPGKE
ncbi:MAG: hypothetical protein WBP81_27375 [Solirubrobacteraceae bacterium]